MEAIALREEACEFAWFYGDIFKAFFFFIDDGPGDWCSEYASENGSSCSVGLAFVVNEGAESVPDGGGVDQGGEPGES